MKPFIALLFAFVFAGVTPAYGQTAQPPKLTTTPVPPCVVTVTDQAIAWSDVITPAVATVRSGKQVLAVQIGVPDGTLVFTPTGVITIGIELVGKGQKCSDAFVVGVGQLLPPTPTPAPNLAIVVPVGQIVLSSANVAPSKSVSGTLPQTGALDEVSDDPAPMATAPWWLVAIIGVAFFYIIGRRLGFWRRR